MQVDNPVLNSAVAALNSGEQPHLATYVESDNENNIQGVFMWYNCHKDDQWSFVYNWDEDKKDGDAIFMAFLFASNTDAWKQMLLKFIEIEPDCLIKKLIGVRHRKGNPTRVEYSTKLFTKILKSK
jgi:hypothetical protein